MVCKRSMTPRYISIGAQCTTPTLFERAGVKRETLPFDWMISTPAFVYTILDRLLDPTTDIDALVKNEFFACDARATLVEAEHHRTSTSGSVLVNTTHSVCFPHNTPADHEMYKRRLLRLRDLLHDTSIPLCFVYVSVSSLTRGNYTLDDRHPIQDRYLYLDRMHARLISARGNVTFLIFDTHPPSTVPSSPTFQMYAIQPKPIWSDLLPELQTLWARLHTPPQTTHNEGRISHEPHLLWWNRGRPL